MSDLLLHFIGILYGVLYSLLFLGPFFFLIIFSPIFYPFKVRVRDKQLLKNLAISVAVFVTPLFLSVSFFRGGFEMLLMGTPFLFLLFATSIAVINQKFYIYPSDKSLRIVVGLVFVFSIVALRFSIPVIGDGVEFDLALVFFYRLFTNVNNPDVGFNDQHSIFFITTSLVYFFISMYLLRKKALLDETSQRLVLSNKKKLFLPLSGLLLVVIKVIHSLNWFL